MNKNLGTIIVNLLKEKSPLSVEEIASKIYVSESTVRRKLTALQDAGVVTRSYGKAFLNDSKHFMPAFDIRKTENSTEKKKITFEALKLIKDGYTVFLDASTSAHYIAQYLAEFNNLTVVTNGVDTLSTLASMHLNAYSTGGKVCGENSSALVGLNAIKFIDKIHADVCFFSAMCIDRNGNCYDISDEENEVRRVMIKNANKSVLLCDSSKFGFATTFKLTNVKDVDILITDKDLSKEVDIPKNQLPEIIVCE